MKLDAFCCFLLIVITDSSGEMNGLSCCFSMSQIGPLMLCATGNCRFFGPGNKNAEDASDFLQLLSHN
jgi:hypothetical protein